MQGLSFNIGICEIDNEGSDRQMKSSINRKLNNDNSFISLFDSTSDLVFLKDLNGIYVECNKGFAELNGLPKEEIIGKNDFELYDEPTAKLYIEDDHRIINNEKSSHFEAWISFPDGRPVFYSTLKSPYRDEEGNVIGILSISRDSTEKKRLEDKLVEREAYLASVLNTTHDGFYLIDFEGYILDVNKASCELLGYTEEELIGSHISKIDSVIESQEHINNLIKEIKTNSKVFETSHKKKNGNIIDIEMSASVLNGDYPYLVCFVRDITEKKNKLKYIQRLSYHDFLTGLYNKRFMDIHVKRMDEESNLPITMIVLDMDNLKVTNDSFGHKVGDNLIKEVAKTIKSCFRQDELIGRVGGDEFLIALPNVGDKEAKKIITRIKNAIKSIKIDSTVVSISAGYAVKNHINEDIYEVQIQADNMMYMDKIGHLDVRNREIVNSYMEKIYNKSPLERLHTDNVVELSKRLGEKLNLNKEQMEDLLMAAKYHDIGKVSIEERVLNKKGSLNNEEYDEIRKHSETGYRILKSMEEFYGISKIVLHHHAKWDGSGYPLGIRGDEIPFLSRIIGITEAYDDMINPRGHKKEKSIEEAKEELLRCSGSQFDPEIVEVFINGVINS